MNNFTDEELEYIKFVLEEKANYFKNQYDKHKGGRALYKRFYMYCLRYCQALIKKCEKEKTNETAKKSCC